MSTFVCIQSSWVLTSARNYQVSITGTIPFHLCSSCTSSLPAPLPFPGILAILIRDIKRVALFLVPTALLIYSVLAFLHRNPSLPWKNEKWVEQGSEAVSPPDASPVGSPAIDDKDSAKIDDAFREAPQENAQEEAQDVPELPPPEPGLPVATPTTPDIPDSPPNEMPHDQPVVEHQVIFSQSTADKKLFYIDFGETAAINPNIIPHPALDDTWVVVAQQVQEPTIGEPLVFSQIACLATFQEGTLRCVDAPTSLPIAQTGEDRCEGDLQVFNDNIGPHDARVFWGPQNPFIVYGSNSAFTCMGQFIQDFRQMVQWEVESEGINLFESGTELQRPLPWSDIEKNFFIFWDAEGQMYVHQDIAPHRVFAQLSFDGSVGADLAADSSISDDACLAKYLPALKTDQESIHQATNSLQITFCKRADPACSPNESNTFLFTIFQHKSYYDFHSVYEPYVMVFQQRAPFEMVSVSEKPLWIHGRERHEDAERQTSDMMYVTSMSWKSREQRYHGYLDDTIFLAFGIEDKRTAGIDVMAEELLANLGGCYSV